ncbi:MAG: hypothetical protein HYR74_03345 [Candidatus Eisenbacteria bacterium]|nr:hypothetical protein [Candidatus Eisenbacteria bacterium]
MGLRPSLQRAITYVAWLLALSVPPNLILLRYAARTSHGGSPREKMERFARDRHRYNLVFVGDSRTYTDFDPGQLDPLLGTRSFNLAHWAHWFPTQYASFRDLIPLLDSGTVVVWSVGHQNFRPVDATVNAAYPIPVVEVPRYLGWGYAFPAIEDNVASSFLDGLPVHAKRDRIHAFLGTLTPQLRARAAGGPAPALENQAPYDSIARTLAADPAVERVRPFVDGSLITSAEVFKLRGNYTRVELAPAYFRGKQRGLAETKARELAEPGRRDEPFAPAPEYWNTFAGALDLFQRHHVRLVVNEVEEAPYNYAIGGHDGGYRAFMRRVRAYVEGRGIPYTRVAWEAFADSEYFDFNHLNSRGIAHFTPLIAAQLRPYVR